MSFRLCSRAPRTTMRSLAMTWILLHWFPVVAPREGGGGAGGGPAERQGQERGVAHETVERRGGGRREQRQGGDASEDQRADDGAGEPRATAPHQDGRRPHGGGQAEAEGEQAPGLDGPH